MILGIHHLTAICSNAQRTVDFYTKILGLRLVKKTVNFDDPGAYHLYFGNEKGEPGTLLTFFEWSHIPRGKWGIGTTHHLAFCCETEEAQLQWKRWLTDKGIHVSGVYNRKYFRSIYFSDPDGLILEIATRLPGWLVDEEAEKLGTTLFEPEIELTKWGRDEVAIEKEMWAEPVTSITPAMKLRGLHHITAIASNIEATTQFYTEVLEMHLLKRTKNYDDVAAPHYYFGVGDGKPGTIITYFGYNHNTMRTGQMGVGLTHHFAFAVADEHSQKEWRKKLIKANIPVTQILDRVYFTSIYFSDPDGHIVEIATTPPGFMVDEPVEELGTSLKLPPWLEGERKGIEQMLSPIQL